MKCNTTPSPAITVTIPRLGSGGKSGRAHVTVRCEIDGVAYGAVAVISGKCESPYMRHLTLDELTDAA